MLPQTKDADVLNSHLASCEKFHPTEEKSNTKPLKDQIEKSQESAEWRDAKDSKKRTHREKKSEIILKSNPGEMFWWDADDLWAQQVDV